MRRRLRMMLAGVLLFGGWLNFADDVVARGVQKEASDNPKSESPQNATSVVVAGGPAAQEFSSNSPAGNVRASNDVPVAPAKGAATAGGDAAKGASSDAERILRLQRSLDADQKRVDEFKARLEDPDNESAKAEAEFKELDARLEQIRHQLASGDGQSEAARALEQSLREIEPKWKLAKERFELAIQERKSLQENVATLEQKIQKDREVLDKLTGKAQPELLPAAPAAAAPQSTAAAEKPLGAPVVAVETKTPAATNPLLPSAPGLLGTAPAPAVSSASDPRGKPLNPFAGATPEKKPSRELVQATEAAQKTAAEAKAAEQEVRSISERIELLQKNIKLERQLNETARKRHEVADQALKALSSELFQAAAAGRSPAELEQQVTESTNRLSDAREESARLSGHLDELQSELVRLQSDQIAVLSEADQKRQAAEQAQQKVEHITNPFTFRNLSQWFFNHGPRILAIFLAMIALIWISKRVEARVVRLMTSHGPLGSRDERENRAKTLVSVFHNAVNLLLMCGGVVMILEEAGIPIAPLVGGAAVVGLAAAFGAQSLIKDYFTGFVLLLEQQYLINDVIKIGETIGQVEHISLRMTVLRDLEGRVHFIPHGEIHTVTNLTHGWSRAVMEVAVAYKEDVDRVIEVLMELGCDLGQDPDFANAILENPTMLGVDELGESKVVIKFFLKTRPLHQWRVKRELLRRIKNRFDELGIEIPFPHRTLYHRQGALSAEGEFAHAHAQSAPAKAA